MLWVVWPIISVIRHYKEHDSSGLTIVEIMQGFDTGIFQMYLWAYLLGLLLLLGLKMLAGGHVFLHTGLNPGSLLLMAVGYPIYAIKEAWEFFKDETEVLGHSARFCRLSLRAARFRCCVRYRHLRGSDATS